MNSPDPNPNLNVISTGSASRAGVVAGLVASCQTDLGAVQPMAWNHTA